MREKASTSSNISNFLQEFLVSISEVQRKGIQGCTNDHHLSRTSAKEKNKKRFKDKLHQMRGALAEMGIPQNIAGLPPSKRKKYLTTHEDKPP